MFLSFKESSVDGRTVEWENSKLVRVCWLPTGGREGVQASAGFEASRLSTETITNVLIVTNTVMVGESIVE